MNREGVHRSTGHTHTPTENNIPDTDTHMHDKNNTPNPQTNAFHKHLTRRARCAQTKKAGCVATPLASTCLESRRVCEQEV